MQPLLLSRGRSRQVSQSALARQQHSPPILAPLPLKPSQPSPLLVHTAPAASPSSSASSSASSSPSSSPPSMSPDSSDSYYDSPPSPPLSLEDQVHVAYAHDDIHTAKILLLRLKGIEVTDDDDPRIAEVQDEDFDYCFAPHGKLVMDDSDEKLILERQRLEQERMEERRRLERLRMCEMKWTQEKRRLREERMMVLRKREMKRVEEEDRRRNERARLAEEERRKLQADADLFQLRTRSRSDRRVVSYSSLHSTSTTPRRASVLSGYYHTPAGNDDENDHSFVYDFMVSTPLSRSIPRHQRTQCSASNSTEVPARSRSHNDVAGGARRRLMPTPAFDDSHSVPFTDVLKSMQGPLFPLTIDERARRSESPNASRSRSNVRPHTHSQAKRRRESELMQLLLLDVEFSEEERRKQAKGKGKAVRSKTTCLACRRSPSTLSVSSADGLTLPVSPTSSIASSSSSRSSRPSSWLSFRSSAPSVASSAATSPSSSPSPSPSPRSSWFKSSKSSPAPSRRLSLAPTAPCQCRCQSQRLTQIHLADSPLSLSGSSPTSASSKPYSTSLESVLNSIKLRSSTPSPSAVSPARELVRTVSASVSHGVTQFVELAKGFQQAYVTVAMFSVVAAYDGERWEEREVLYEEGEEKGVRVVRMASPCAYSQKKKTPTLNPAGCRVSRKDVAAFLATAELTPNTTLHSTLDADHQTPADSSSPPISSPSPCVDAPPASAEPHYIDIPLGSPYPPQQPPSTVLPKPLPYATYFKPIPPPTRSPFRFNAFSHIHTTYPDHNSPDCCDASNCTLTNAPVSPKWRIRSVGNPEYLRLKALQNIIWRCGMDWQGRGREMGLGGGRDRVVGVAFEGLGCSRLGRVH